MRAGRARLMNCRGGSDRNSAVRWPLDWNSDPGLESSIPSRSSYLNARSAIRALDEAEGLVLLGRGQSHVSSSEPTARRFFEYAIL